MRKIMMLLFFLLPVSSHAKPKMVTLTGSGVSYTGRSVGMLKQFGFCDVSADSGDNESKSVPFTGLAFSMINTDETEHCRADTWVGFFGSTLSEAVASDSVTSGYADSFRNWSIFKAVSFVSMPIFLFTGISMMNADITGPDGQIDPTKSPRPLSIAITAGAGVGFIGWVVGNIMEQSYLTKVRDAWNTNLESSYNQKNGQFKMQLSKTF